MKRTFSILTLVLIITIAGLAFGIYQARQEISTVQAELDTTVKFRDYLKGEVGYLEPTEDSRMYLRELEQQIPLARKFALNFPYGKYRLCSGNYLGGDFVPENVQRHSFCELRFSLPQTMEMHISENPSGETEFSVYCVCYNAGMTSGGKIKHDVDIRKLNYSDDQHGRAAKWRIGNKRPHGEVQVYEPDTRFIPLFLLKDGITLKDADGKPRKCEGLAFWFEPVLEAEE